MDRRGEIMQNTILTNFVGGEISPKLLGRVDIPKYYQSCLTLENLLVMPQGGATRRPGTYYVTTSKTASKKVRLIPFEYSLDDVYILEFGDQYIRVYKDHARLGAPYEVAGSPPYLEAQLLEIQYVMIDQDMYLFHPSHAPRMLSRTGDTAWTVTTPTFMGWDLDTEKDITAMTAANPIVVTAAAHGYSNGNTVRIYGIKGMPEANYKIYKAAGVTTDTFQLTGVDGTSFTPYVSGGNVIKKDQIFDNANNYPSCVALYGNRMIVGATNNHPTRYWGCKIGDFLNMVIDTDDDDAFSYSIGAKKGTKIVWIAGKDGLCIGSNNEEYIVPGENGYLTPTNTLPYARTRHGSKNIQAELVNDAVLFFQRAGKRLREYIYSDEIASYHATDITVLADHITGDGVVEMALQTEPQTILWCVTAGGELIGLTYERQYGIVGWHRHPTDGTVESVAVIPTDNEDEIWISVLRSNSDSKRYIEYFKPRDWGTDQVNCFFVDSGITFDGGDGKNITGVAMIDRIDRGNCESTTPPMIFDETAPIVDNVTFGRAGAESGHTGTYSYKVTKTIASGTSGSVNLVDNVNTDDMHGMIAGNTYTLPIWVYVPSTGGPAYSEVILRFYDYDSGWEDNQSGILSGTDTWEQLTVTKTIRAGATGIKFSIYISSVAEDTEFFYVDDIELIEHTPTVTSAAHGFENDQIVKIRRVVGMVELNTTNDGYYMVKNKATDIFQLYHTDGTTPIDGTAFTAFDSGITGDTTRLSDQVTDVSTADIATLAVGMSISGSGIPSDTTITAIDTDSFTISDEATATAGDVSLTVTGHAQRVIKTMTGLDHLDDKTVDVLADGAAHPQKTVSSGSITLERYANKVHAGLNYESHLQPMELETRGKKVRIAKILIRFYETLGCKAGPDEDNLETLIFRKGSDPMDSPPPLFTGEKETPGWKGGYEDEGNVLIVQDQPLPLTVLALIAEMQTSE